jgi:diguanylate cyclase (GGDEF)-like protein
VQVVNPSTQPSLKHDILTDLPDRMLLRTRLKEALFVGQRDDTQFALLVMGLNRFREINQTLGYHIGDLLLKQVGARIRALVGENSAIVRLGGVEFAILIPAGEGKEEFAPHVRRILKGLEQPFTLGGLNIEVQASIGIALLPEHGVNVDAFIQRANIALSEFFNDTATTEIYTPEQDQSNPHRLVLVGELRRALVEDQLFLLYQPKTDLRTGYVTGVEALARWKHPKFGIVPPDQFVPLAERTGLIMPLTLWVLHEALRQCRAWNQAGLTIGMAANLSMFNLQAPELPDQIAGLLAKSGIAPSQLKLEITESAIMANPERTMENLTRMSKMGLQISIDDFGTGYSSLAHLKKLPVHELKIDKSFVMNMAMDKDDAVIVRATIDLGHHFGLKVVAEGVEDQNTRKMLSTFNCDMAQGFFFSKPLPAVDLVQWLAESQNSAGPISEARKKPVSEGVRPYLGARRSGTRKRVGRVQRSGND